MIFTSQLIATQSSIFWVTCSWSSCLGIIRTSRSMHSNSAKTRPQKDVVSHQWKRWVKGPLFLVPEQGGSVPILYNFVWSICVYVVLKCCQLGCFMLPTTCYPNRRNLYKSTSTVKSHSFPWKTRTLCPGPISSGACQRFTRLSPTSHPSGCVILIATATP